jgi:hypothetical protein
MFSHHKAVNKLHIEIQMVCCFAKVGRRRGNGFGGYNKEM